MGINMNIRTMSISDYKTVYSLWISCVGMGLNNLDDSQEGIKRFIERNPDTCFVAEEDIIIGVIMVGNEFWEKQGFTVRDDLIYRNKTITEMIRIVT